MEYVLEIENLCKNYKNFQLKDVSFALERGRIMGFIGRNGAGKSTTLKSIMNFIHYDGGEIRIFGKHMADSELELKQKIGFVTGGIDFYTKKKLGTLTAVTKTFFERWDEGRYRSLMDQFGLLEEQTPAKLSAGMKLKYTITLALSHGAELLILDEPTSGLDPVSREELLDMFIQFADEGKSILFSSHITSDLDRCADDVTYIREGRIEVSCGLDDLLDQYRVYDFQPEDLTPEISQHLIGTRRLRRRQTALIRAEDAEALGMNVRGAELEDVMVHLEHANAMKDEAKPLA